MTDDQGGLPIKLDETSNGELPPTSVSPDLARAKDLAAARLTEFARRTGVKRRAFLAGLCGAATTLLTLNEAFAARGNTGGGYHLHPDAALDLAAAEESLGGDEFIFDVQTHMVDPKGGWREGPGKGFEQFLSYLPQGSCGESDPVDCYSAKHFLKEVFFDSDTDMAVMSFVPAPPETNPLSLKEAARVRDLVVGLGGKKRLLLHAMALPNVPPFDRQLDSMQRAHEDWPIAAWKTYTQWGPGGAGGWSLTDPKIGIPFIEKARALGVRTICIHKGLPLGGQPLKFHTCEDVGPAAKMFPDVNFIIYHSGFEIGRREGPYDRANARAGIDSLIKSLEDSGIGRNANVYAELGSTWRFVMRDPTGAAHAVGKLLKYVGQDRVLWGTDSIWYGSPQDQIQAFRSFWISQEFQDKYGYPALGPSLKAKIFGLNGAAVYGIDPADAKRKSEDDGIGRAKAAYRLDPSPSFATHGPKTMAEYLSLLRDRSGLPG